MRPRKRRFLPALLCALYLAGCGAETPAEPVVDPTANAAVRLGVDQYYVRASDIAVKPGDVVCIEAGRRPSLLLKGFQGTAEKPITIINCGGQALIGRGSHYGFACHECRHLRITGSGDPEIRYGIKIDGTERGSGLSLDARSSHIEVERLEIANTHFAGIVAKTDGAIGWVMEEINIHDNYIHDTGGEGMYIGETKTPSHNLREVRIWNNTVVRTGWDLFQIANADADVKVHNNVFVEGGLAGVQYQQNGVQLGDNTVGEFHHNIVVGARTNGFIVMGSGNIDIHHNYIDGAAAHGFFVDNRSVSIPGAPIRIRDNHLRSIQDDFFLVYNEVNPIAITGNRLAGSNRLIAYASGAGPNVTLSNNVVGSVAPLTFSDTTNGRWCLPKNSPYAGYGLMGCR